MDDLFLNTLNNFIDVEVTNEDLSKKQKRNKKNLNYQTVRRNTRSSKELTLCDTEICKSNSTSPSDRNGKKDKESSKCLSNESSKMLNTEKHHVIKKGNQRIKASSKVKNVDFEVMKNSHKRKKSILCGISMDEESAECHTKKTALKHHVISKENMKRRETLPKVKKTVKGTSLSKTVLSQSLSKKRLTEFGYYSNSVPVDDLTADVFSTPNTLDSLFSSNLCKRKSASLKNGVNVSKKLIPGKGSLKRKRFIIDSLKGRSEGYEDDLFENYDFKDPFLLDDSDMSDVSIATPKCAYMVTPNVSTKTPTIKDCYSPFELLKARKIAEEYMHKRNKKRRNCSIEENSASASKKTSLNKSKVTDTDPEKKKLDFQKIVDDLNTSQKLDLNDDSEEEDDYFNNISF